MRDGRCPASAVALKGLDREARECVLLGPHLDLRLPLANLSACPTEPHPFDNDDMPTAERPIAAVAIQGRRGPAIARGAAGGPMAPGYRHVASPGCGSLLEVWPLASVHDRNLVVRKKG